MNRSAKPNRDNVVTLDPRFNRLLGVFLIALLLGLGQISARAQEIKLKAARFDPLAGPVVLRGLPSEKLAQAKPAAAALKPRGAPCGCSCSGPMASTTINSPPFRPPAGF